VEVVLAPTLVQGDGASAGVCRAIQDLNDAPEMDLIIVCRGGGSMEDLWTFNLEAVARAIFASRVPVISAVGHETDYTIADFVADHRAATPSAAAEIAVPDRVEVAMRTGALAEALGQALRRRVQEARWDLESVAGALLRAAPDIGGERRRVASTVSQGSALMRRTLDRRHGDLGERYLQLNALSPMNTLARGYALIRRAADHRAVASARDVTAGDGIQITLDDGELRAEVIGAVERNGHR
jgi:exodeoxyribonuclease VII large subunit